MILRYYINVTKNVKKLWIIEKSDVRMIKSFFDLINLISKPFS
jgi:hypothetical protein